MLPWAQHFVDAVKGHPKPHFSALRAAEWGHDDIYTAIIDRVESGRV